MQVVQPETIAEFVGKEVGVSDWVLIDQARINRFADVTEDHQFIHVDPEAAKATPLGGAVAHGFLTLSMLTRLAAEALFAVDGVKMGINYGFDKVRFITPVKAGKRIRGRFTLMSADQRIAGQWSFKYAARIEIEGETKPALIAEWRTIQIA